MNKLNSKLMHDGRRYSRIYFFNFSLYEMKLIVKFAAPLAILLKQGL